jgi:ketosteroid isomerase-like protein
LEVGSLHLEYGQPTAGGTHHLEKEKSGRVEIMKSLFIFVGFVCLIAILLPACAPAPEPEPEPAPEPVFDQAAEESAVRDAYQQLLSGFNNHDAKAMMSMAAESIEFWNGGAKGLTEHEKWFSDYFGEREQIKCEVIEEVGVVFVSSDVAIYKIREEYTGRIGDDGNPTDAPFRQLVANVFAKENGRWLWAARFARPIEE